HQTRARLKSILPPQKSSAATRAAPELFRRCEAYCGVVDVLFLVFLVLVLAVVVVSEELLAALPAPILQVSETMSTLVSLNPRFDILVPPPLVSPVPLAADALTQVPVSLTVWPTCAERSSLPVTFTPFL